METFLPLLIFLAVALLVATAIFLIRDLTGRGPVEEPRPPDARDVATLLPTPEMIAPRDESWLGQLAVQSATGFTAETAFLLAVMAGLMLGGLLYFWRDDWLAGAAGGMIGMLAVGAVLVYLRARRFRTILEQLPDAMELMARAVRAGESLDQAIALAGSASPRPVAAEFQYCANQMRMGLSLETAMQRLVERAPLAETRILAMTLIVQRRRGGNLPITLDRLARVFRDRLAFYRQFRAATAAGRASTALIVLVALGLDVFVIFGNSEYAANLSTTSAGQTMLALAIVLQFVGVGWLLLLFRSTY